MAAEGVYAVAELITKYEDSRVRNALHGELERGRGEFAAETWRQACDIADQEALVDDAVVAVSSDIDTALSAAATPAAPPASWTRGTSSTSKATPRTSSGISKTRLTRCAPPAPAPGGNPVTASAGTWRRG
ncbi:hypothetical protein [Amycolatopsis sp. FDAARGOS 1241]|uniref:hypothetical protein n=1 Tax=Amycolatopsis sp. FDAARGOS 1241 TaxID=2778070 RepID=UPI00195203B3|nr:hypothetical protein [Amycolatopsis sp. FDAARGOS 1241]QRP49043.1 hypothetical protein I6J71_15325 [Amycolatopsis sp. FDAARGOS 1241]